jgi:3',5'-cyclic AMP phosphodiesterase CpdA
MRSLHTSLASRFLSRLTVFSAVLLAGCSLLQTAPPSNLLAAYVVVGENGAAWARAITPTGTSGLPDAACPLITIDGAAQRMQVRAAAAAVPQRPTASDATQSKPSDFPVTTCEFLLPANALRADIAGRTLRLPKASPQRIVVIGDTGCRMKKADNAWQACMDQKEWPFRTIAENAAAMAPDLVVHVGDYHYRENACPPTVAGCQNSPWGYGWDTWQADLFEPAAKLLAAAPWVFARGNHEECRRAGQGWFRFLDAVPFTEARSCNDANNDALGNFTPPFAVPLSAELQLIVFDSAVSGNGPLDPARPRDAFAFNQYRQQFSTVDALAAKLGVASIFVNHHPILGYSVYDDSGVHGGNRALLSVMKTLHPQAYYPASVRLALHGHVHLFEAMNFSSNHPATILSGMGGDELSTVLPDPFPMHIGPAEGVTLESITHANQFGFVVMDKREASWQIGAYDVHGTLKTTCVLSGSKLRCDKTGLLK